MKFATKAALLTGALLATSFFFIGVTSAGAVSNLRQQALRDAARAAGVSRLSEIHIQADLRLAAVGEKLFASSLLSFNSDTSCQTCHLDRFSSADGLPNAVGTGGSGEGQQRLASGGDIVPRNALPLWGRGTAGFNTFFWDGKVRKTGDTVTSQFGTAVPSGDPLEVAVHLPFVEIRELVARDQNVRERYETETVGSASEIFDELARRIRQDSELGAALAAAAGVETEAIEFTHIAKAVAAFIREKFVVEDTAFHSFIFDGGSLSDDAIRGGLVFYGKGQCASCHSGTLMSDLTFHAMPFPQVGFGKNGFGVDYGRYNVTFDPRDLYAFRTPPLINVTRTAPYSHSGSITSISEMIRLHVDPLARYDGTTRTPRQRREDLARILAWRGGGAPPEPLDDGEIQDLTAFLKTLETR